jgi:hypothetical protein
VFGLHLEILLHQRRNLTTALCLLCLCQCGSFSLAHKYRGSVWVAIRGIHSKIRLPQQALQNLRPQLIFALSENQCERPVLELRTDE